MNVEGQTLLLPLSAIREPQRPIRETMDDEGLHELAESIRAVGLIQALAVVPVEGGQYEVRAGHRRLKALRMIGATDARCLVLENEAARDRAVMVHENAFREELNPAEEATYYAQLYEELQDTDAIAKSVRRPREYVEARLNLLRGHKAVFEALAGRRISLGVALELQKITDEQQARFYLTYAERGGCTVAVARQWRQEANARTEQEARAAELVQNPGAAGLAATPLAAPAPSIFGVALPHELSSSSELRPCLFCRETSEEWRMLRKFVCAPCGEQLFGPGGPFDPNAPKGQAPALEPGHTRER